MFVTDFHDKVMAVEETNLDNGHQVQVRFKNGWSASVVKGSFTYGGDAGLYEFGVYKTDGAQELDYENPVTPHDVIGWLNEEAVADHLHKLADMTEEDVHQFKVELRRKELCEGYETLHKLLLTLNMTDPEIINGLPFGLKLVSNGILRHYDNNDGDPE